MVMSYHFVLEAGSLIEDFLSESGGHRYLPPSEEGFQPLKTLQFFWQLFASKNSLTARVGRPLDVFGNFVDEQGHAIGPNGTHVDAKRWLTTGGVLRADERRDAEYTRELGARIVDRLHKENTVLSSHLVAFALFESLRRRHPELDLYRFLRLTPLQRTLRLEEFLREAEFLFTELRARADRGELILSQDLLSRSVEQWVRKGAQQLGYLHDAAVVKIADAEVSTEDMNLLYYYRNRLTGYGLSGGTGGGREQGFLD